MSESDDNRTSACNTKNENLVQSTSNLQMPSSSTCNAAKSPDESGTTDNCLSLGSNEEYPVESPVDEKVLEDNVSNDSKNGIFDETGVQNKETENINEKNSAKEESNILFTVENESKEEGSSSRVHNENIRNINMHIYRDNLAEGSDNSDSSDSDSSSTVSDDNDDVSDDSSGEGQDTTLNKIVKSLRTEGELGLEDLPPIEDLEITVDETKCKEVGTVYCIVNTQVVIQSFPNTPPLNLDTVLFLDRGQRPLGKIFDVLGNVKEPLYAVRFNSRDHIKEKNITKDQTVYCAPQTEYTSYVNTAELLRTKGSDASWHHNNEPPVTCLDFSDDEEEARFKRTNAALGSKRENQTDNELFVKKMNQRNLELTAKRKKEDEAKQKRLPFARRMISNSKTPVDMGKLTTQSFTQFSDNYKLKAGTYVNGEQASASSRLVNFHHNSNNTLPNKFEPARSVNFLVGGYSSPPNFTFPPQHYMCSSPRQLPNVAAPSAQNYLTMYSRPSMHSQVTMPPPPPPPPPSTYSSFSAANMSAMSPAFPSQPAMHPALPPSMHASMPPQFSTFSPLSGPPLPTSIPQPNFFQCSDTPPSHQPAFIPLNVRPGISAASFHPQFVLPPPPPPLPSIPQHHLHQRELAILRPDRRSPQSSHHQAPPSFYPRSPFNS